MYHMLTTHPKNIEMAAQPHPYLESCTICVEYMGMDGLSLRWNQDIQTNSSDIIKQPTFPI